MEMHNCVIFIQETDPDLSTHREFADNEWHFYAIGNIGDSKKTDKTRLTDPDDDYECCVEIMDVDLPLSAFPRNTMVNAMSYTVDEKTNERDYVWAKDENLDILYEAVYTQTEDTELDFNKTYYIEVDGKKVNAMGYTFEDQRIYLWAKDENLDLLYELVDGEYIKTSDTTVNLEKTYYIEVEEKDANGIVVSTSFADAMGYTIERVKVYTYATQENLEAGNLYEISYSKTEDTTVNLNKTYFVDILEHDDFSEDFTYGWRYISDDEDPEIVNACKQAWIEFYRFVTTSSDEEFKANLKDYFIVDSALYYYLFTTRYCMVDNRAKNTFWHYGKAADGTRKWDLCWDYDNDTSLGLNNFGKQLYRYGLEDIDQDSSGKEVFRQSDSLFFCRLRDLFGAELKAMYNTLESKSAWNAASLINTCDEWQEEFPEELWRIDIERKYIRTYNSSFINGQGDKQFLTNMANGKMKYHRRQWERSQEQYMASKYQTPTAMDTGVAVANFRVSKFTNDELESLTIRPNYQLTLTPYSYIYLNVFYNSGTPISVRAVPNVPTVVPYISSSADIINVGSAASIRDFGDLAPLYADTISVQNATRVKSLKIGDRTVGYENKGFSSLTTGSNGLLEELDISNIVSFSTPLALKDLINLKKLWAAGTSIPSIAFANGGKVEYAELPAVNDINLKGLRYLSTTNFKIARNQENQIASVVDLAIENCPLIDQFSIFSACPNLNRVKLDNVNFGTQTYEYFVNNIFKLKGIDDDHVNAQLTGTVHIEELSGEQFNELKLRYPSLKVTYTNLLSQLIFMQVDNETEYTAARQTISNAQDGQDPIKASLIETPTLPSTAEFSYEFIGWSTEKSVTVADENALKHIEGDRILYPVFRPVRRKYTVTFINATEPVGSPYHTYVAREVLYGTTAVCTWSINDIIKRDAADPAAYIFNGWSNADKPTDANVNITGDTICYATFTYASEATLTLFDISGEGLLNRFGRELSPDPEKGYTLDTVRKTIKINACKPSLNASITIPSVLTIDAIPYTVTGLGCFYDTNGFYYHGRLAHIKMADTITELLDYAFRNCSNLVDIEFSNTLKTIGDHSFENCTALTHFDLPATVTSIGKGVFLGCRKLTELNTENNQYFNMIDNCLVSSNTVLFGLYSPGIAIPTNDSITTIIDECFINNGYLAPDLVIPKNITTINGNAFKSCSSIQSVSFENDDTYIGATCFNGCSNLTRIELPRNLKKILSYVFSKCPLTKIELPATISEIGDHAFSDISGTDTEPFRVIFAEGTDVTKLKINAETFAGCKNVHFELPWTEVEHEAYFGSTTAAWGASNTTFSFGGNN
jgi:hypothetical protein